MSLESFVLLRVDNREVAGVSAAIDNAEQAVVTVQSQGVYLYNIYDQKCVTSWLFGPSSRFDGPAHQLASKNLVVVQDKKFLVSWDESDVKLQKMVKRSFDEDAEIVALVVDKKLGGEVGLVFSNGTVALTKPENTKFTTSLKLFDEASSVVVSVNSAKRTQNDIGIFVLASNEKSLLAGSYTLHVASCIHTAHDAAILKKLPSHKLPTIRPDHVITTSSFDASTQFLSVVWDDGMLEFFRIPGGPQGMSAANSLTLVHQLQLKVYQSNIVSKWKAAHQPKSSKKASKTVPEFTPQDTLAAGITVTPISDGHVVLGGPRDANSSSSEGRCLLTVWDTRYGLVQLHKDIDLADMLENKTSTSLPSESHSKSSKQKSGLPAFTLRQAVFSADKNVVLLNFGQVVLACPTYVAPSSLAQALGAQSTTNQFLSTAGSKPALAHQYDYFSHAQAPMKAKGLHAGYMKVSQSGFDEIVSTDFDFESQVIQQLSDRSKTSDYTSFMEVFNSFVAKKTEGAQTQVLEAEIEISQKRVRGGPMSRARPKKWKNLQDYSEHEHSKREKAHMLRRLQQQVDFSPAFVQAVVTRCLQEDYLWSPLRKMLESRCVSLKSNPTLLTVLKSQNRLDLVAAALAFVSDISELELVGIFRWVVHDLDSAHLQIFVDEHVHRQKEADQQQASSSGMEGVVPTVAGSSHSSSSVGASSQWQSAMDVYLNAIINMSINGHFLQYCMQLLSLREVVAVLRYLLTWFEHSAEFGAPEQAEFDSDVFSPPPLGNVVAWANAIIDSHLSDLILVPECGRLLRRLQDAIVQTIDVCDGLQRLRGCLVHYFDHDPTPRDSVSDYSIELLRL